MSSNHVALLQLRQQLPQMDVHHLPGGKHEPDNARWLQNGNGLLQGIGHSRALISLELLRLGGGRFYAAMAWPPRRRRLAIFLPILPHPIIAVCMALTPCPCGRLSVFTKSCR